ncbi:MAG TPA: MASE3 domain-containing protein [Holophagaceae bacterium]|nr:MASE3 domain-containing protein [Holophagaceae bacterium]
MVQAEIGAGLRGGEPAPEGVGPGWGTAGIPLLLGGAVLLAGLAMARLQSYLLFHSLAELISISIAFTIQCLVWNTRELQENGFLKVIGTGFVAAAGLDLVHTLSFKGMPIFTGYDANLPTQLWIAARYLQALSLLAAPLAFRRRLSLPWLVAGAIALDLVLGWAIFTGRFPTCFREGFGLTTFKAASEYVIVALVAGSIALLHRVRGQLHPTTYRLVLASALATICAELAFTAYIGVHDLANMVGHLFKLVAYYALYRAIFVTGIRNPFATLFRELKASERLLRESRDSVQRQVETRTKELGESRAMLGHVLDTIPQSVFWKDLESRYLGCNRRFATECGFTEPADVVGKTDFELPWPREEAEAYRADDQQVLASNEAKSHIIEPLQRADGTRLWIDTTKIPLRDEAGRPIAVLGVYEDITQRRAAEQALAASEARYRSMLATATDGVWLLDEAGRLLETNEAAARMLGYAQGDLQGRVVGSIATKDDPRGTDLHARSLDPKESDLFETRLLRKDGSTISVEISISRLRDAGQRVAFVRDITSRKQLEMERNAFEEQLHRSQKMESLGSLAGGVAHDINNVLGAILALASIHLEKAEAGTPLRRDMETILNACSRGGTLVKGLLGFARQGLAVEQAVDLNALIREEVALLAHSTLQKVRLEMDLDPSLRPILGDQAALHHALMNLCVNAVDAMPGGGTLTLLTRNTPGGEVLLEVRDTGQGMTREILDKALDPFFTTKPQGKGTGLGLAMVYRTIQAHGGRMELASEPGKGTRVKMGFPEWRAAPGAGVLPAAEAPAALPEVLEVLLVDDDELIRESVPALLEMLGHRVTTAESGREALDHLRSGYRPDVIILDMNMPDQSGGEVLPDFRAMLPSVPILLATGRVDQVALDLVATHPHTAMLPKPFRRAELMQVLAQAVARPGP